MSLLILMGLAALTQSSKRLEPHATLNAADAIKQGVLETYARLPMRFEVNHGQTDPQVRFLSRGSGYMLYLTSAEAVLSLREATTAETRRKSDGVPAASEAEIASSHAPAVLRMKLIGSNSAPRLAGLDELPGKSNYFIGNDPKKWRTNIPNYSRVRYENVYAGVDLIYYGSQGQLEYDFVVAPA
ncbi:MAG: hypothetical protein L0Z53_09250, partial [Acidobacteriales bacterium]|nr:hypothetical protein [Terriglobales bacterium]